MLGEKPGPSAPDPRADSGWMAESGAAVLAVCACAAALCVCGAFLLYRAFRGRGRLAGHAEDAADEHEERAAESTEASDDGGSEECDADPSQAVTSSNRTHLPSAIENELENGPKEGMCDLEEPEAELHGDVDEPSETESAQETIEAKNVHVQKCQSMEDLLDSTLLAQDVLGKPSKMELLVAQSSSDASQPEPDNVARMDEDVAKKGSENGTDHVPQLSEFDRCCFERSDLLSSNLVSVEAEIIGDQVQSHQYCNMVSNGRSNPVLDHTDQSFLGFATPTLPSDSAGWTRLPDVRSDVVVSHNVSMPVDVSWDRNEINIMEAIMDSNEWLNAGPPDTRDLPWLPQTHGFQTKAAPAPSNASRTTQDLRPALLNTSYGLLADESQSCQEKAEGFAATLKDAAVDVGDNDEELLSKKVAAVCPMPQMVRVSFRVHYVTHSPSQLLAVTGNQQELGVWESFVPLLRVEDWFWANSVSLPAENQVEWKFVLVEDGKVRRWEECGNRRLVVTGQEEEIRLDESWGYM